MFCHDEHALIEVFRCGNNASSPYIPNAFGDRERFIFLEDEALWRIIKDPFSNPVRDGFFCKIWVALRLSTEFIEKARREIQKVAADLFVFF